MVYDWLLPARVLSPSWPVVPLFHSALLPLGRLIPVHDLANLILGLRSNPSYYYMYSLLYSMFDQVPRCF